MKKTIVLLAGIILSCSAMAGDKKKAEAVDSLKINWMTLDDAQAAMKKQPKKVFIDVYTDWCGWCRVMDKKTFSNKEVIKYLNKNFYAVKLNAEQRDSIRFVGKMYGYDPSRRANTIAIELLQGKMSYPSSVIMEENFQNSQAVPGYLDVPKFEMIIKYLGENIYKTTKFDEYSASFKPSWSYDNTPVQQSDFKGGH